MGFCRFGETVNYESANAADTESRGVVVVTERREFRDLTEPERVHEVIESLDIDPGTETVDLQAANGRILAERIDAALDVPGFDRASMDGYAVRARETFGADEVDPTVLGIVGTVHAGQEPDVSVDDGTAVEISTGAVMPPGADAVVMVEQTTARDGDVEIRAGVAPGDNVMLAGNDIAAGARALGPGRKLTPREIGLLSALGIEAVPVRARPTVGIISTGGELVRPGGELDSAAGQIYDVNSYTIASGIEEAGGEPALYPHVSDDFEAMEQQLRQAATECDLVLTSGSTSASAVDVLYRVIEERGTLHLHGVAIKPGKPMLVGEIGGAAYIGLPGYPVSALTIFRTFVAPALRAAAGEEQPETETVTGKMAVSERYDGGRRRLMPVGLVTREDGELLVYPVDKGSGATTSLVDADGTVAVPATTNRLAEGEAVDVQLFSPAVRPPTMFGVGEDDPLWSRLLDTLDHPRYLPVGTREGLRQLRSGVPDIAVVSGPIADTNTTPLGSWDREWGLIVPPETAIEGIADLVDTTVRFVNRDRNSGLSRSFDEKLERLAAECDTDRDELADSIDGYSLRTNAHESPARTVLAGDADAGLGLRATAASLDLEFVSLGTETVQVLVNPDRRKKAGVKQLETVLNEIDSRIESLPGFDV